MQKVQKSKQFSGIKKSYLPIRKKEKRNLEKLQGKGGWGDCQDAVHSTQGQAGRGRNNDVIISRRSGMGIMQKMHLEVKGIRL